jgi:hypothetical protein
MPDGEKVFLISTPSAGLWSTKQRLEDGAGNERFCATGVLTAGRYAGKNTVRICLSNRFSVTP